MIELKTRITNLTDRTVPLNWAGISLPPRDSVVLEGAYPTACARSNMHADISSAVASGMLKLELLTSLDAIVEKQEMLTLAQSRPVSRKPVVLPQVAERVKGHNCAQAVPAPLKATGATQRPPPAEPLPTLLRNPAWYPVTRIIDGIPQVKPANGRNLLHLSQFPRVGVPKRCCIVGKGPSIHAWESVPDIDAYFALNEATYAVNRQHFACRGDGNRKGHRFCDWLPSYAVPMVHERIKDLFGYGYWFTWDDIGSDAICLTVIQAVRLAYWMGCRDITMCGCDALFGGTTDYAAEVANIRNQSLPFKEQRDRFSELPAEIIDCCQDHQGRKLRTALTEYLHAIGA